MSTKNLMTAEKAAKELGVSPRYVRKLCETGKIKAEKVGASWLFDRGEMSKINVARKPQTAGQAAATQVTPAVKQDDAQAEASEGQDDDEEPDDGQ